MSHLILLIVSWTLAYGEVTSTDSSGQSRAISNPEPSTCEELESGFRSHLIGTVAEVSQKLARDASCLRPTASASTECGPIRTQHLQQLRDYRDLSRRLHQEMANDFLSEAQEGLKPALNQCFGNGSGKAQLSDNLRVLRSRDVHCVGLESPWSSELSRNLVKRLNGEVPSQSLSKAELDRLKAYHFSPLTRVIEAGALYDQRYSDQQLQAALANALSSLGRNAEKLRTSLAEMKSRHHYLLYDFDAGLETYAATLSDQGRSRAQQCREQSTFTQACLLRVPEELSQCGQRAWRFAIENISIIAVVNAHSRLQRLQGAETAGIMSQENLLAERTEAATAIVFSVAGHLGLAGPLVRGGQRVARNMNQVEIAKIPTPRRVVVPAVTPKPPVNFTPIESADSIKLFNMQGQRPQVRIEPGRSYTAVVHEDELLLGEEIIGEVVGSRPGSSGSHVTLMKLAGARWPKEYEGQGGTIRFNLDGTIDISGYHHRRDDIQAAELIRDMILSADPKARVRITGGKLSEFPPP